MGKAYYDKLATNLLNHLIKSEYEVRGLKWPQSADDATDWALTELAEVKELLLARKGGWVRNNPGDHPGFDRELLAEELGDVIRMCIVAGIVEGVDALAAMVENSRRKMEGG